MSTEAKTEKMDEIKDIDARIDSLQGMRKVLLNEWASENCPYAVGDIVDIRGYSHTGKKCRVDKIGCKKDFRDRYQWTVRGTVILKDGTAGKNIVDWDQGHEKT